MTARRGGGRSSWRSPISRPAANTTGQTATRPIWYRYFSADPTAVATAPNTWRRRIRRVWERNAGAESRMYIPVGRFKKKLSIQVTGFISDEVYAKILYEYEQELLRRVESGR